jgi:hypothetical protein
LNSPPEPTPPPEEAPKSPPKLQIGAVAGLPRPEGFVVEDLRTAEMKAASPFKQTYKAPMAMPFQRQQLPLAKYERKVGDAELEVSPIDLLAEKLIEHYGDRLRAKRLAVREFSYVIEQKVDKHQGMIVIPLDPGAVVFAIAASAAGTAMMSGRGVILGLAVKIDAELDGRRIAAIEPAMDLSNAGAPVRVTRYALDKFVWLLDRENTEEAKKD